MEKETKEIIKLTTREILKHLENGTEVVLSAFDFSPHPMARVFGQNGGPILERVDWQDLKRKIQRLKQRGLIRKSYEKKQYYIEITEKGKELIKRNEFRSLHVERPAKWDKKWRIVIYDIPEDDHGIRDIIRGKLYQIGFEQMQKSVFVYPFECTREINLICQRYGERGCLKYMIADIIEGEESITEIFIDKCTLRLDDLA